MNENSKRRTLVKCVTIVFFTVILLLTFFSNTIMNYSLPKVATYEITSDKISAKVRGSGVVESAGVKEVMIKESREVSEVLVKVGDEVKEGDVLIKLKEGESTDIILASKEVESLKASYQNQILISEISKDLVTKAENGGINYDTASKELENLRKSKEDAQKKVENIQKQLKDEQDKHEKENAKNDYSGNFFDGDLSEELFEDEMSVENILENNAITNENKVIENQEILELTKQLEQANKELADATEAHSKYLENITTINDLKSQYEAIKESEAELQKLKENVVGNEIKAEVSGIIMSVDVKKKDLTMPELPLVTIQDMTKGYTLSFSVPKEQASKVKKGDEAQVVDSWYYDDVKAVLSNIKIDKTEPLRNRILEFEITGGVNVGEELSLSIGEKSHSYDYVVPNSAIKEDKNGNFILVIKEKSSPLGNRYIATRVDVEIITSDDSKSAIKGEVEGGEYVITTANKMINIGDYVRFND